MKPEDIIKLISEGTISSGDAFRTISKGSSYDRILFTTVCKTCGNKVEEPLRWFDQREARCACGGEFEMEPLRKAIREMAIDSALPKCLRLLPEVKEERGQEN